MQSRSGVSDKSKHGQSARLQAGRCLGLSGNSLGLVLVFLFQVLWMQPAFATEQRFVTIGTGGVTGVYYPIGTATCRLVNTGRAEHGLRCSAESTLGSIANLNQIRGGVFEFGFMQSDWQKHAYRGTSAFEASGPFQQLRRVLSLHSEIATIVVRDESSFETFNDLKGSRVSVGRKGSGSAASWDALSSALGWTKTDLNDLADLHQSELAEALCSGRIDAYFVLIGHPARLIEETADQCNIRLLGLDQSISENLNGDGPSYTPQTIASSLYGLSSDTPSLGVTASLVTTSDMPEDVVETVVRTVYANLERLSELHPALSNLKAEDLVSLDKDVPLHPGALKFFQEQGLVVHD